MMIEPATPTATTVAIGGVAILAALPGVDAAVVLGAFSGAVVFVMTSAELSTAKKFILFLPAFFAGILCCHTAANIIATLLPETFNVGPGVGAMIAATLVVKFLIWLLDQSPGDWWRLFRGGNNT